MKKIVVLIMMFCLLLTGCSSTGSSESENVLRVYEEYMALDKALSNGDWEEFSHIGYDYVGDISDSLEVMSKEELSVLKSMLGLEEDEDVAEKLEYDMLMCSLTLSMGKAYESLKGKSEVGDKLIQYFEMIVQDEDISSERLKGYIFNMFPEFEDAYKEAL